MERVREWASDPLWADEVAGIVGWRWICAIEECG
jgi:hypothetical protein